MFMSSQTLRSSEKLEFSNGLNKHPKEWRILRLLEERRDSFTNSWNLLTGTSFGMNSPWENSCHLWLKKMASCRVRKKWNQRAMKLSKETFQQALNFAQSTSRMKRNWKNFMFYSRITTSSMMMAASDSTAAKTSSSGNSWKLDSFPNGSLESKHPSQPNSSASLLQHQLKWR